MAPTVGFRILLVISTLMILVGTTIVFFVQSLSVMPIGWLLIFLGAMFLIVRSWEERQSRRAMGLT
jgi:Na+/phosphate symporter